MTKQCSKCKKHKQCNKIKELSEFHINNAHKSGFNTWCKACVKNCTDIYYNIDKKEHKRVNRNNHYKRNYGITLDQYNSMFEAQEGKCAICKKVETLIDHRSKKVKNLAVDHCHKTGKVRELLCCNCNKAFGFIGENLEILTRMIEYAKKHQLT